MKQYVVLLIFIFAVSQCNAQEALNIPVGKSLHSNAIKNIPSNTKIILPIGSIGGLTNFSSSPSQKLLLCEDEASHIIIYDSYELTELLRLEYAGSKIKSSSFLNDSIVIFIADDTTIVRWDLFSNRQDLFASERVLKNLNVFKGDIFVIDSSGSINRLLLSNDKCKFSFFSSILASKIQFKSKDEFVVVNDKIIYSCSSIIGKSNERKFVVSISTFTINNSNGNILIGFVDGSISEFDFALNFIKKIPPSSSLVSTLNYVNDSLVAIGSYDFTLRLQLSSDTFDVIYFHEWIVGALKIDDHLIIATWDGQINAYNFDDGLTLKNKFKSYLSKATAFKQKASSLFIAYNDGYVKEFSLKTFTILSSYRIFSEEILNFDISDDMTHIVAFSADAIKQVELRSSNVIFLGEYKNFQAVKFLPKSYSFIFSTSQFCYVHRGNRIDSIDLIDGWAMREVYDSAILVSGTGKIAVVGANSQFVNNLNLDEWIYSSQELKKGRFLISSALGGIRLIDRKGRTLSSTSVDGTIVGIELLNNNNAVLLDEIGILQVFNLKTKKKNILRRFEEYSAYDFLLNPKNRQIVLPFSSSGERVSNLELLDLKGHSLNKLLDIGGYVVCAANSYSSLDFNLIDSNKIIFITTDGCVKVWDINEVGRNAINRLGVDYNVLANNKLKEINADNVYLRNGILKIQIFNDTLTYIKMKNNDWLIYDKHFRFDGTPDAIAKLYFSCDLVPVYLNQVKDSLYVPNLLNRYINGEDLNYLPKLSNIYLCGDLPKVAKINISTFRVTAPMSGISSVELYIQGILRAVYKKEFLIKDSTGYLLQINTDDFLPYISDLENPNFEIIVRSNTGITNSRSVRKSKLFKSDKKLLPSLHAIMIGVDLYRDQNLNLQFASKDANGLQNALQAAAKEFFNFDSVNRVFFYNLTVDQYGTSGSVGIKGITPDRVNIMEALRKIKIASKPEDVLLFFFAGHGEIVDNDNLILLTTETKSTDLIGLKIRDLLKEMNSIPAGKRILILDACHSGAAINNLGLTYYTGTRDIKNAAFESNRLKELDLLASKSGFAILTASSSNQLALELPQFKHGLLTYSLLSSLATNREILNSRNQLVLDKWFIAAEDKMQKLNPNQTAEKMVPMSFPIGVVNDSIRAMIKLPSLPMFSIKEVFNESQIKNDEFPLDNLKIRDRFLNALFRRNAINPNTFLISSNDEPISNNIYIKYYVQNGLVYLNFFIYENSQILFKYNIDVDLNNLDSALVDVSEIILNQPWK